MAYKSGKYNPDIFYQEIKKLLVEWNKDAAMAYDKCASSDPGTRRFNEARSMTLWYCRDELRAAYNRAKRDDDAET